MQDGEEMTPNEICWNIGPKFRWSKCWLSSLIRTNMPLMRIWQAATGSRTKDLLMNSSADELNQRVKEKFEKLEPLEKGGISRLKIQLDGCSV